MVTVFEKALAFAARNERTLGAVLFVLGFFTDLFTFGVLPIAVVNYIFLGYLTLAVISCLGAHAFSAQHASPIWWKKTLAIVFPLGAQYAFGGLLSGFVVFYTAHSVFTVSWPFLVILALVFIGNEYFRMYKHYLVFQTTLLFFSLYAYVIFGVPILVGSMGPWVFVASTIIAVVLLLILFSILHTLNRVRYRQSRLQIIQAAVVVLITVSGSYALGVIPPIPLIMKEGAIYQSLSREGDTYVVQEEASKPWWNIGTQIIHHAQGSPLYAYTAVQAPVAFGSLVVHRWQRYDEEEHAWKTVSKITFPIKGGRVAGYRGYTAQSVLSEGKWRVSVETANGQVIGRIRFDVRTVDRTPPLYEKTL